MIFPQHFLETPIGNRSEQNWIASCLCVSHTALNWERWCARQVCHVSQVISKTGWIHSDTSCTQAAPSRYHYWYGDRGRLGSLSDTTGLVRWMVFDSSLTMSSVVNYCKGLNWKEEKGQMLLFSGTHCFHHKTFTNGNLRWQVTNSLFKIVLMCSVSAS